MFALAGSVVAIAAALVLTMPGEPSPPRAPAQASARSAQPVSAARARALMAAGALVADVREPAELAESGKLQGAVNVPLTRIKQLAAGGRIAAELQAAKDRPVILYCRSGRRSEEAGAILLRQGFTRVYNLGGFEDAVKAGLPASKPAG